MQTSADTDALFVTCMVSTESDPREDMVESKNIRVLNDLADQISESSLSTCIAKQKSKGKVKFYLETKYNVVRAACSAQSSWLCVSTIEECDFIWTDVCMAVDRFAKLKPHQRYNHFVGMNGLTRKNNLGRNLLRMKKFFKEEYSFFPETWILPMDLAEFKCQPRKKHRAYIIKPDNSCQGRGIYITQDLESVKVDFDQGLVAQVYINRPFLLDGYKFDLRIYVLVSGCDPLRVYVHKEGLVRLCCTPWDARDPLGHVGNSTMHLTNYAVNVKNVSFRENRDPADIHDGHKRSMSKFFEYLSSIGHNADLLVGQIDDLIIKTLISVQPSVAHVNFSCQPDDLRNEQSFEILGFDVMLDADLKPWLLEVNHAPSFATESELDILVKLAVLKDTLGLLAVKKPSCRKNVAQHKANSADITLRSQARFDQTVALARLRDVSESHVGGFRKIYPRNELRYARFHDKAIEIWETLTGAKSRPPVRIEKEMKEDAKRISARQTAEQNTVFKKKQKKRMKVLLPRNVISAPTKNLVSKTIPITVLDLRIGAEPWWNLRAHLEERARLRSRSLI